MNPQELSKHSSTERMRLLKDPTYINPELREIFKKAGPMPSLRPGTDIRKLRSIIAHKDAKAAAADRSTKRSNIIETDHEMRSRDGSQITLRLYRGPRSEGGPVAVVFHGGGWIIGNLNNEAGLCRDFAEHFDGVAINVEYRLTPEVSYPTPLYDCYDAVIWAATNPKLHGGNPRKGFIVAGVSAGANMAAVIAHMARDEDLQPPVTGSYLSIPSVIPPDDVPEKYKDAYSSRVEHENAPIFNKAAIDLFKEVNEFNRSDRLISPLNFKSKHFNLPPTYFQAAGMDPLRDEALVYERILREEHGIKTKLDLYPGLPHEFWRWFPQTEFTREHRRDTLDGLRWLLRGKRWHGKDKVLASL